VLALRGNVQGQLGDKVQTGEKSFHSKGAPIAQTMVEGDGLLLDPPTEA
jgi:hypothetical protein